MFVIPRSIQESNWSIVHMSLDEYRSHLAKYNLPANLAERAHAYFLRYGYYAKDAHPIKAIKGFQEYFGLEVDGELGPKTVRAMGASRCGCRDTERLEVAEARLGQKDWTVYIQGYVDDIGKSEQLAVWQQIFQHVSTICNLNVKLVDSKSADVIVDVGRGSKFDFDGSGGVLGWAEIGSTQNRQQLLMLDLDETWVLTTARRGILIAHVGYHEFGHIWGLTHSKKNNQLLSPYYSETVGLPQSEDIQRLVSIYGKPLTVTPIDPPLPPTSPGTKSLTVTFTGEISNLKADGWFVRRL